MTIIHHSEGGADDIATAFLKNTFRVLLGGKDVACVINGFIDESGIHPESLLMCVAGYLFKPEEYSPFDQEWKSALDNVGVGTFRMSDFVSRRGEFISLTHIERKTLLRKLVAIINARAAMGFVVSIPPGEAKAFLKENQQLHKFIGSTYTFCLLSCLQGVGNWVRENYPGDTLVHYFYENGRHTKEAGTFLHQVNDTPRLREMYRLGSYSPVRKTQYRPTQAADILAWAWHRVYGYGVDDLEPFIRESLGDLMGRPLLNLRWDRNIMAIQVAHLQLAGYGKK